MKTYPSLPHYSDKLREQIQDLVPYWYGKEDGSNVRVEWDPKRGFHKWGRRNGLLDDSNPFLKESPRLFEEFAEVTDYNLRQISRQKEHSATVYMEFFGPNSRFGQHQDEPHRVQIFDIAIYKKGFLPPVEFNEAVPSNNLLCRGWREDDDVVSLIRRGELQGMPFEGCVGKTKNGKFVFKLKAQRWFDALKSHCGDDEKLYKELM